MPSATVVLAAEGDPGYAEPEPVDVTVGYILDMALKEPGGAIGIEPDG
jgi:hypothetical protein